MGFPAKHTKAQPSMLTDASAREYSKKRAAAIWLFLRGDARSLGNPGRANLREQFTQKWYRSVRDFKPLEYILELPQPSVFERDARLPRRDVHVHCVMYIMR